MDVTDYQELLSGRREEGTAYSVYSFVRKLGHTVAGAGASGMLGLIGYKGTQAVQSPEVLTLMFVLMAFCYKLTKNEVKKLHEKLYGNKD